MVINGDFINKTGGYDDINGNYPLVNRQKTIESHHLQWVNRCDFDWAMAGPTFFTRRGHGYPTGESTHLQDGVLGGHFFAVLKFQHW